MTNEFSVVKWSSIMLMKASKVSFVGNEFARYTSEVWSVFSGPTLCSSVISVSQKLWMMLRMHS